MSEESKARIDGTCSLESWLAEHWSKKVPRLNQIAVDRISERLWISGSRHCGTLSGHAFLNVVGRRHFTRNPEFLR